MKHKNRINLFGHIEAVSGVHKIKGFTTIHCRNLLAYLALNADMNHTRERLIEVLWPGREDGSTRNRFSVTLYHLRKTLGQHNPKLANIIEASRGAICLNSSKIRIDYLDFCESVSAARSTNDDDIKREQYSNAVEHYSAPLLEQINADWSVVKQFECSEAFHEAAIWLASDADNSGNTNKAKLILSGALKTEPNSERSTELLTNWYAQEGEPELAITCARRLRSALATQGRTLSKSMHDRISELNLILSDRTRAVVFANELTLSVLSINTEPNSKTNSIVQHHDGRESVESSSWLFNNPIHALEAAKEILIDSPDTAALIHTTIMSDGDEIPAVCKSSFKTIRQGELLSTEVTGMLLKARGIEPKREFKRRIPMCKYS